MPSVFAAFKSEMQYDVPGTPPILERHVGLDGLPGDYRLLPMYFHEGMYGAGATADASVGGTEIAPFFPADKSYALGVLDPAVLQLGTLDAIEAWFAPLLLAACEATAVVRADADSSFGADQVQPAFVKSFLWGTPLSDTDATTKLEARYEDWQAMRPYLAWRHLAHVLPGAERNDFVLVDRLYTLARVVFALGALSAMGDVEDEAVQAVAGKLMAFLVDVSLEFSTVGEAEQYASNVEVSKTIHDNSSRLIRNKEVVQTTQDNLRSLANVDRHVRATREFAKWTKVGLIAFLVVLTAALAAAYAAGRTGEMHLMAGAVVTGVAAFEAFKGTQRLFAVPASALA